MRVAIIDDEQKEREILKKYLKRYAEEFQKEFTVTEFSSGEKVLENYKAIYDAVIFDIDMPGINGMDTARKIREIDKTVVILFITNVAQYAVNGYEVDAVDYIIKPIGYYDFSMKFSKVIRKVAQRQNNFVILETLGGIKKIEVRDIFYVEVLAHYVFYHTKLENYKIRGSMKIHNANLSTYNFVRIHKSYLVNLVHVEEIRMNELTVAGRTLPVGRAYKEQLLHEYMKYVRG